MVGSQWRPTPELWLILKLAAIVPIVMFLGQVVGVAIATKFTAQREPRN